MTSPVANTRSGLVSGLYTLTSQICPTNNYPNDGHPVENRHVQGDDEVEDETNPMDTPPTLAIGLDPGPKQPVRPLKSQRFWCIEILLVGLCISYFLGSDAWTMWREGTRITGPIDGNGYAEWVTVRDPATELVYTLYMRRQDHDVGTTATVIVHPTDRSKVLTPTDVYRKLVIQLGLLVLVIAYPIKATVVHRPRRSMTNSLEH